MSQLPEPQAFADFRRSIETTTLDELRALPDTAVESASALEEMREYLLDQYDGVTVERSYLDDAGRTVDLVAPEHHPAVRRSGDDAVVEAPAPPPAPESGRDAPPLETAEPRELARQRLGLQRDEPGRDDSLRTQPVERVSLDRLARFGHYPLSWFQGGEPTTGATRVKFAGEVETQIPNLWPPMGSGAHASAGVGKVAYHHNATVYPAAGGAVDAMLAVAGSTNGPCYTIEIFNQAPTTWGTFLHFGGPGGTAC